MDDKIIIEAYFKALGWVFHDRDYPNTHIPDEWLPPDYDPKDGRGDLHELPNILDSYPAFKEHVLEVMGEEGYKFACNDGAVWWWMEYRGMIYEERELFKDNNILHAAVIAATRYLDGKE